MRTHTNKITLFAATLAFSVLFIPAVSFAQTTLNTTSNTSLVVQCDGTATSTDASGTPACNFNTLIDTGTHLIDWMFYVSVPIMVALLAYSGILYMTGIEKNISRAKGMFKSVAIGFTIMLIAFVVVDTVVGWVGNSSFTNTSSGTASNPAVLLNNQ